MGLKALHSGRAVVRREHSLNLGQAYDEPRLSSAAAQPQLRAGDGGRAVTSLARSQERLLASLAAAAAMT